MTTEENRVPVAEQGWDSHATVIDGRWLERVPRRPEVRPWLEVEARLMPRLAPLLPLDVPVPVVVDGDPWRTRHELVPGEPAERDRLNATDGRRLGEFLRTLHDVPRAIWEGTGLAVDADRSHEIDLMGTTVLPLLPEGLRAEGAALLDRCRGARHHRVLRHGDLGPDHLLTTNGRVTGVIDWTDVALGDPALDLSWLLHRTPREFAESLAAAYGPTPDEVARSRDWNVLAPWWEVRHGLLGAGEEYVESGLAGVIERLSAAVGPEPAASPPEP